MIDRRDIDLDELKRQNKIPAEGEVPEELDALIMSTLTDIDSPRVAKAVTNVHHAIAKGDREMLVVNADILYIELTMNGRVALTELTTYLRKEFGVPDDEGRQEVQQITDEIARDVGRKIAQMVGFSEGGGEIVKGFEEGIMGKAEQDRGIEKPDSENFPLPIKCPDCGFGIAVTEEDWDENETECGECGEVYTVYMEEGED